MRARTNTALAFESVGNKHKYNTCMAKALCTGLCFTIVALTVFFIVKQPKEDDSFDGANYGPVEEVPDLGIPDSRYWKIT